jgi:crotonobetainyl-CoA:carnitine CoA-transferase CaiB-like acyl-CoA transferase
MVEAALNIAAEALLEAAVSGREPRRNGNRGPGASPQGVYRCAGDDDWVALAVLDDEAWRGLARLVGLTARDDLASEGVRRVAGDDLDTAIGAWTAGMDADQAVALLRSAGVAAARVGIAAGLLTDPHLLARRFWTSVEHPVVGEFLTTGLPFRSLGEEEPVKLSPAPTLGQHNEEIFTGLLGIGAERLGELAEQKVIGTTPAGL